MLNIITLLYIFFSVWKSDLVKQYTNILLSIRIHFSNPILKIILVQTLNKIN